MGVRAEDCCSCTKDPHHRGIHVVNGPCPGGCPEEEEEPLDNAIAEPAEASNGKTCFRINDYPVNGESDHKMPNGKDAYACHQMDDAGDAGVCDKGSYAKPTADGTCATAGAEYSGPYPYECSGAYDIRLWVRAEDCCSCTKDPH